MQRYFVSPNQLNNGYVFITGSDVHHIKNVMRMQPGDKVICAFLGKAYLCEIEEIANEVRCKILECINKNSEVNGKVTIAHGLVRREKTEEVVRRLTELGCFKYIPLVMKRSIVKVDKINDFKYDRYLKIIKEASEQSQRNYLMNLGSVYTIDDLLKEKDDYDLLLLADANEDNHKLGNIMNNNYHNILIVIGPEGGFEEAEKELLVNTGFKVISFGNRVLRTETAPLYAMSVLGYILGDKDED